MVSLNYRNYVLKKLLYEKITPNDISDNEDKVVNIIKKIRDSGYEDILVKQDGNVYFLYVLKNLNDKLTNNSGSLMIQLSEKNSNNDSPEIYSVFDVYEIGEHGGLISNYENEVTIILKTDNFKYPDSFLNTTKKYFLEYIEKKDIIEYIKLKLSEINDNISKNTKQNVKMNINKIDINSSKSLKNLTQYKEGDFDIAKKADNKGNDNKNLLISKSSKNKIIRFAPKYLIGDDKYRKLSELKSKVKGTLQNFDKEQLEKAKKVTTPLVASAILYQLFEKPYNKVTIDENIFTSSPEVKAAALSSKEDINLSFESDKNMFQTWNQKGLSSRLGNYLTTDPNEILSAEALVEWKHMVFSQNPDGKSSKDEILNIFGSESDINNALIQFPNATNTALIDSWLMIGSGGIYRKLGISTKGGISGEGAPASISSLFQFLFDDDKIKFNGHGYNDSFKEGLTKACEHKNRLYSYIETDIVPKMSKLGKKYWDKYPEILSYLIIFGGSSPRSHSKIVNNLIRFGYNGIRFNTKLTSNDVLKDFAEELTAKGLTKLVMDLLDKQKYKFCQINTTPTFIGNQISYKYEVQYPARFSGEVKFEKAISGNNLRFHIMGSVK